MAPLKQHMYQHLQHLRSAKEWLTKAEEAFGKEHDVRAELDLMLAEAELQHVKEANRSRQWRYKYLFVRHGVAVTLAMFLAVAIGGGVYWWGNKSVLVNPAPLVGQASLPVVETMAKIQVQTTPVPIQIQEKVAVQEIVEIPQKTIPPKAEKKQEPAQVQYQPEPTVVVSTDEMQKMVRAAGKSLRGQ